MTYSRTVHTNYQRVYFYKTKQIMYFAKDVVLTGAILAKIELTTIKG